MRFGRCFSLSLLLRFLLSLMLASGVARGQDTLLDAGYRQMYNLQFDGAHRSFRVWQKQHPHDPMGPVSDAAAYLFSEFERLHILELELFTGGVRLAALRPDPKAKRNFDRALERTRKLASRVLRRAPNDRDAMFASVLRLGLRADYLAMVEKKNLAALGEVNRGRVLAEKLVAADPDCYDAYLTIGVENYLLSLKPAPVRWLLRAGGAPTDRELGLEKIALTAERGRYLLPYARVLLAVAALREKNPARAREILEDLSKEFPGNWMYAEVAARLR
jgi:hypothetical protein